MAELLFIVFLTLSGVLGFPFIKALLFPTVLLPDFLKHALLDEATSFSAGIFLMLPFIEVCVVGILIGYLYGKFKNRKQIVRTSNTGLAGWEEPSAS